MTAQPAVIPCPECRAELYDRVAWDEGQQLPVCPDCGADVSAGDVERLRDAISALLDKASDPITVDPRGVQDRYALVPWYLIEGLRKALGPVDPDTVDDRRYIWIDPGRRSGEPCIGGTRVPPEIIGGYVWAGDDVAKIADDYSISMPQVLVACWYLGTYGSRVWKKRWGVWAKKAGGVLWSRKDQDQCPLPPTMKDAAS